MPTDALKPTIIVALLGAAVVSGIGGYVIGQRSAEPPLVVAPPSGAATRTLTGLICAAPLLGAAGEEVDEDHDRLLLQATLCQARLEQLRSRDGLRESWPYDDGPEVPATWTYAVEDAFSTCSIPATIEQIDCTEYPCIASLRSALPIVDDAAHKRQLEVLERAVRACGPLRAAFGVDDTTTTTALDVFRLDARCETHRERFFVLLALSAGGPAHRRWVQASRAPTEDRDLWRWFYRRADDAAMTWRCGGSP